MNYTSGPWAVTPALIMALPNVTATYRVSFSVDRISSDQHQDNARLISAAPDLLRSLVGLVDAIGTPAWQIENQVNAAKVAIRDALGDSYEC